MQPRHGPHRKHAPLLSELLCNLAASCSMVHREHFPLLRVNRNVFTELLPSNALIKSIAALKKEMHVRNVTNAHSRNVS
jgi:hypothetical protein